MSVEEQTAVVNRSLGGDQDAFGQLIDQYKNAVYGLLLNRIRDSEEAEDLTQETFIQAYVHLGTLREPSKFSHWLYTIARNLCTRWLARRERESEVLEQLVPVEEGTGRILMFSGATEPPTPEEEYESQEMKEAIWKAIGELPEKSREGLLLSYFNEMSCGEVAEFLGVAPSTVRSHLRHGREKLKDKMLPLAKEVIDEKRLTRTFTKKVVSALPLIPPRSPTPKPGFPLGRWILSLKGRLLGITTLALTAGLIGLLALGRGEKQPFEVPFPMFPVLRVRLATPDEMDKLAEHLEEEEEMEISTRATWMARVLGALAALVGTPTMDATPPGDTWMVYTTENSGLPGNLVFNLAVDPQGNVWMGLFDLAGVFPGAAKGIAKFDGQTWTVYSMDNSGLPYDQAWPMGFDDQGNTWIATATFDQYSKNGGGVAKFDGETWIVYILYAFEFLEMKS